ncbi:C1 family peptidase [Myxococcota bacterium]
MLTQRVLCILLLVSTAACQKRESDTPSGAPAVPARAQATATPSTVPRKTTDRQVAVYEPALKDPILEKIKEANEKWDEDRDDETGRIRDAQEEEEKKEEDKEVSLVVGPPAGPLPGTIQEFESVYHFEPQAQYYTGTCWAFSGTSFLESEVFRLTGKKIKLSEMYAVYYEYLEKARRFVQERGDSLVDQGSQLNSVTRMWKIHGAMPLSAYRGVLSKEGQHNHKRLTRELQQLLSHVKQTDLWDESLVLQMTRALLNKHVGEPPTNFTWEDGQYTAETFLTQVLEINPDDYVQLMSTMRHPFYTKAEFEVPDNWWHDDTYYNVPLSDFFAAVKTPIQNGFSIGIGGDVSEPGKIYRSDIAYIPSFDIPFEYIDQSAREYRITSNATTDDHGVHLVGWAEFGDKTWFLVKDSGRSSRHGKVEGYYFFREDFIKLKMLTAMVHRDAVEDVLAKFKKK